MANPVRTARGDLIDFDALKIKQDLAASPQTIAVARRKNFIDSKEGKGRGARKVVPAPEALAMPVDLEDTEIELETVPFVDTPVEKKSSKKD